MKFTSAGSDYFVATAILAGVGIVGGWRLFAALALGLAFASAVSLAVERLRAPRSVEARVVSGPLRVMKNEKGRIQVSMPGVDDQWVRVEVESVSAVGLLKAAVTGRAGSTLEIGLAPRLAGRFTKVELGLRLEDALGLFYTGRRVNVEGAVIDSLPLSLITPLRRAFIPPLVVGEAQAEKPGRGQEFYGIETYTQHSASKDILWSRAAKEPNKPLLARVREANNPESVTIEVFHGSIPSDSLPGLVDLQCEALGTIGRALILAGVRVEIVGPAGSREAAGAEEELAEAIMHASEAVAPSNVEPDLHDVSGILVMVGEIAPQTIRGIARRPSVFIGGSGAKLFDRFALSFTGTEDLTGLVSLVLSR